MQGGEFAQPRREAGGWLRPESDENDLRRYLATVRERRFLILVCVAIATLAAVAYVTTATPVYQAQANILVMPVNATTTGEDPVAGLSIVRASSDPTRDVQTAAELIRTAAVAQAAIHALRLRVTPPQVLGRISVTPVAQSNIVAVTAQASGPLSAAALASAFASAAIRVRQAEYYGQLDAEIAALTRRMAVSPPAVGAQLGSQLTILQELRSAALPDMRVATAAQSPTSPSSPRKALSIVAGVVAGLILGLVAAFALQALDPRLRREEQLRRLFHLPILARIPREGATLGGLASTLSRLPLVAGFGGPHDGRLRPLDPASMSPASLEAYRTVRATLLALRPPGEVRSVLVTGTAKREGKTTTAINLAVSLAWHGATVVLIEADVRRPSIGRALNVRPEFSLVDVLKGKAAPKDALVQTQEYGPNLQLLLARGPHDAGTAGGDELLLASARYLLASARELADFIVVDSPPLTEVVDALELALQVDEVLLVARLGETMTTRLRQLGTILVSTGIDPVGIVLVGTEPPRAPGAYGYLPTGAVGRTEPGDELFPPHTEGQRW